MEPKIYSDCGVQTDTNSLEEQTDQLQDNDARLSTSLRPEIHLNNNSETSSDLLQSSSTLCSSAYTRSNSDESLTLDNTAQRNYKYPQLNQLRPSAGLASRTQRIVSLPDTEPSPSETTVAITVTNRVVSLPERFNPQDLSISNSSEDSLYVDCLADDDTTEASRLQARASGLHAHRTPPSSPESVMIIGNNTEVSRKFLRHRNAQVIQRKDVETDGWETWANSPPKPIPALHGPLSLPYARCPSGAEGTLIEGTDDLPRMIWGLGDTEGHPNANRKHNHNPAFSTSHKENVPVNNAPIPQRRAPILSLDYPHSSHAAAVTQRHEELKPIHTKTTQGQLQSHKPGPAISDLVEGVRDVSIEDIFEFEDGNHRGSIAPSRMAQLQHMVHTVPTSSPFMATGQAVPSNNPRIFIGPRADSQAFLPARRMTFDEMAQYNNQHPNIYISPPSSSSTQWTPIFSNNDDRLDTPEMIQQHTPLIQAEDSDIFYQRFNNPEDFRNFGYRGNRTGLNVHNVDLPLDSAKQIFRAPNASEDYDFAGFSSNTADYNLPGPPPNLPLPPLPAPRTETVHNPQTSASDATLSPGRADTRSRGFDQQSQPRSVPLARLIQRRLATVPEEEHNPSLDRKEVGVNNTLVSKSPNAPYFQSQSSTPRKIRSASSIKVPPNTPQQHIDKQHGLDALQQLRSPSKTFVAVSVARQNMERSAGLVSPGTARGDGPSTKPAYRSTKPNSSNKPAKEKEDKEGKRIFGKPSIAALTGRKKPKNARKVGAE